MAFLIWAQAQTGNVGSAVLFVVAALALVGGDAGRAGRPRGLGVHRHLRRPSRSPSPACSSALFPDVMPSSTGAAFSLTTSNASATDYTLTVMTVVAAIFTPIVLVYQAWTYWVFRKRISEPPHPRRGARGRRVTAP